MAEFLPSPVKSFLLLSITTQRWSFVKCKCIDKHGRIFTSFRYSFFCFSAQMQIFLTKLGRGCRSHMCSHHFCAKSQVSSQLSVPGHFQKRDPKSESRPRRVELTSLSSSVVPCHFKRTGTSMLRRFALLTCKLHLLCQQLQDQTLLKWCA